VGIEGMSAGQLFGLIVLNVLCLHGSLCSRRPAGLTSTPANLHYKDEIQKIIFCFLFLMISTKCHHKMAAA
jgi:hypothetical protein